MSLKYHKLRQLCLHPQLQIDHPDWPYSLLFHGHEITREIFFLDPLVEYGLLPLGKNLVPDAGSHRYPFLNKWFHYRFFNGLAPIVNSAESTSILVRLMRLRRGLLDGVTKPRMAKYLELELDVDEAQQFILRLLTTVAQLIQICTQHDFVVWGMRCDANAVDRQMKYIKETISKIPSGILFQLPHVMEQFNVTQTDIFIRERDLLFKAEERYLSRRRNDEQESRQNVSRRLQDALNGWCLKQ